MSVSLRDVVQSDTPMVKEWLTDKENAKWLDPFFQNDELADAQVALFLMRKDKRTFVIQYDDIPVGIMGLMNIDMVNRSAEIWSLLGNKEYRRKGIITVAHHLTLEKAFFDLDLHSVHAWVAEGNYTTRVCEKLNFSVIGRQRECHMMDGVLKDRILFDILREEFDVSLFSDIESK